MPYQYTVADRFCRYVQIDTQSDPLSDSYPTTEKQKNLGKLLVAELLAMGIADAHLDEWGYVYATLPANSHKNVPVICFCSHMDTSPDCSGMGVKPLIHLNYDGSDLVLPDDPTQIIRFAEHPALAQQIGNDIITASGTTLLGADNKAGVAEIMDAIAYLLAHPDLRHGTVKILFTPDEEVGKGTANVDLQKLGAQFAYTIDGETLGTIEDETFSADAMRVVIQGVSIHPGFAKGKMENAIKIAADIVAQLPKNSLSPETTEGREGFVHPTRIAGTLESAEIDFIVRDFTESGLAQHETKIRQIVQNAIAHYPNSTAECSVTPQYRNFKQILDQYPQIVDYAEEAIRRAGVTPLRNAIRGGTDGSRLSYMGLPCPNIFAGEHAFHSKLEWVSVQDMQKAVDTIVHLCQIWEEKSEGA
ncbi:MAG: peptidase T [Chitinophagales bacterium]|nr:peptidase T [Chitinophagales bacterium]